MFGGNARHTGVAAGANSSLMVTPLSLAAVLQPQASIDAYIRISSDSSAGGKWTLSEVSDSNNIVSLPTTSGALGGTVAVRLNAPGNLGSYDAVIRVESAGLGSQNIAVRVIAARNVSRVKLPIVAR
jgi:hypothetical protein